MKAANASEGRNEGREGKIRTVKQKRKKTISGE